MKEKKKRGRIPKGEEKGVQRRRYPLSIKQKPLFDHIAYSPSSKLRTPFKCRYIAPFPAT